MATAEQRRPPGAEGDGRCTVYDARYESERDATVHSGRRRRSIAICVDRDPEQRVTVTVDRKRTFMVAGVAGRQTCRDAEGRHIRIVIARPGPTVSACPALD